MTLYILFLGYTILFKRAFFSILLIVSIVSQSFASAAVSLETHQVDAPHLQTEHNHDDDNKRLSNLSPAPQHEISQAHDTHDIKDCHHCGHCSGTHLAWVLVDFLAANMYSKPLNTYTYQQLNEKYFIELVHRPPIS